MMGSKLSSQLMSITPEVMVSFTLRSPFPSSLFWHDEHDETRAARSTINENDSNLFIIPFFYFIPTNNLYPLKTPYTANTTPMI